MNEKELIKTSGIWQGGNDWRSPLPWLPQLAHRATCYPSTPVRTPRYTLVHPVHPGTPHTPATHQHSVTNNAEVESGKKTELEQQMRRCLLTGAPASWHIRRPIDYSQPPATDTFVTATIAVSFTRKCHLSRIIYFGWLRNSNLDAHRSRRVHNTTH